MEHVYIFVFVESICCGYTHVEVFRYFTEVLIQQWKYTAARVVPLNKVNKRWYCDCHVDGVSVVKVHKYYYLQCWEEYSDPLLKFKYNGLKILHIKVLISKLY